MHIRKDVLDQTVEQLRRTQAENGLSLREMMEQLTDSVIGMFGLSGAGLMLVDDDQLLRTVLATDDLGWALENGQETVKEGPCVDAVVYGALVSTRHVCEDERWPRLASELSDSGVGAVLGVPIRLAGATVGALNVYVEGPHEWDDSDHHALTTFGGLLEAMLSTSLFAEQRDSVVNQLQEALDSRIVIERCVGVLMGRDHLDAVTAFNQLRDLARPSRRKVHDIAQEILTEYG